MAKRVLPVGSLIGGEGEDKKLGVKNGFYRSRNIDFRSRASRISLTPAAVKESASVVDTAVKDMVRVDDGTLFLMGGTKIYRRNKESQGGQGSYTEIIDSADGLGAADSAVYNKDRDKIYIPDGSVIHAIDAPDNATTDSDFTDSLIGEVLDYENDVASANNYFAPPSISETDANKFAWQPEVEPFIKVSVYIGSKTGTPNLIATLHDAENNLLATTTLTNAELTVAAWNEITFTPVRMYVKPSARTYHVHFTNDSGAGTIGISSVTASDLQTARIRTYANRLVSGVYHPISEQAQYIVIGNERYISVWEPITDDPSKLEFEQHRLKLPPGYIVIGITEWEEMTVISAKKSVSSDYGDNEWGLDANEGLILFWDRISDTYNWFKVIKDGAFESIYSANGLVYGIINGVLHVSDGGLPVPIKTLPGVEDFTSTNDQHDDDVYLKAPYKGMTIRRNVLHIGFPEVSVNDNLSPGMYSFGTNNVQYPESFGHIATPSHGDETIEYDTGDTPDTPLSGITYVGRFGANTFMAWTHGASDVQTFGVDVIRQNHDPAATGYFELFEFDDGLPHKEKQAIEIHITYEELPTNTTVAVEYKIDHEASWQDGSTDGAVHNETDDKKVVLTINKLFHTIDIKGVLTGNSNGSPKVKSVEFIFDDRAEEGF